MVSRALYATVYASKSWTVGSTNIFDNKLQYGKNELFIDDAITDYHGENKEKKNRENAYEMMGLWYKAETKLDEHGNKYTVGETINTLGLTASGDFFLIDRRNINEIVKPLINNLKNRKVNETKNKKKLPSTTKPPK